MRWLADTGSALAAAAATRALAGRGALPDPAQVPYNYPRFDLRLYSAPAPTIAGCELVAGTVTDLDSGHGVQLRAVVGERPLVLEFGSVTCPVYLSKIDRMRLLTARCTEVANFAVLYTREAHPGPRYPPHATLADKRRHAADLRTLDHEQRRILIDDVDGTVHRRYGTSPDSVLIVGTDGIISFWSEWNEPDRTERELQRLLAAGGRGAHVTPRQIERNFQPPEDSATALRLCLRPGLPAFADFIVQLPGMAADRARAALWR